MRLINLIPLQEIDFPNQRAFDQYNKVHKLRPDTKVVVAGRVTTAGRASQNSAPVKGTSIFSKDAEKNAQSSLANDKESPFKVTYVDDKGNTQIANTFKSKDYADNYASHFSPSSQVKVVSADDKNEPKQKLSRFPGGKEYPTFGNPLEGFPTKYKELLKKLQRSNDSSERHMLINKMNVIRKKLNLIPLTGGDNKKSDDKSADYPVGSLQYRLQKNNPKDAVKYDNQLKATTKDIADLTDNNDHNGAVMALAKMMGDKSSIAEMEKIQRYHELKGHMPQSLTKYRSSILNNLLVQAKKKYGDKVAKQLHSSF